MAATPATIRAAKPLDRTLPAAGFEIARHELAFSTVEIDPDASDGQHPGQDVDVPAVVPPLRLEVATHSRPQAARAACTPVVAQSTRIKGDCSKTADVELDRSREPKLENVRPGRSREVFDITLGHGTIVAQPTVGQGEVGSPSTVPTR